MSLRCSINSTDSKTHIRLNLRWPSLFTNVYMDWHPTVSLMNSTWWWTLKLVIVCDHPFHHHWLSTTSVSPPSATDHFRLLLLLSGTVFFSTSPRHPYYQFSGLVWRPISSHCRFPCYCKVPSQWLGRFGHFNRSFVHSFIHIFRVKMSVLYEVYRQISDHCWFILNTTKSLKNNVLTFDVGLFAYCSKCLC